MLVLLVQCTHGNEKTDVQKKEEIKQYTVNLLGFDAPKHVILAGAILAKERGSYPAAMEYLKSYLTLHDPLVYLAMANLIIDSNLSKNESDKAKYTMDDAEEFYILAAEKSKAALSGLSAIYRQKDSVFGYNPARATCLQDIIEKDLGDVRSCY